MGKQLKLKLKQKLQELLGLPKKIGDNITIEFGMKEIQTQLVENLPAEEDKD